MRNEVDQVPESKKVKSKEDITLVMEITLKDNSTYLFLFSTLHALITFENELWWRLLATTKSIVI